MAVNMGSFADLLSPEAKRQGEHYGLTVSVRPRWVDDCCEIVARDPSTGLEFSDEPRCITRAGIDDGSWKSGFVPAVRDLCARVRENLT